MRFCRRARLGPLVLTTLLSGACSTYQFTGNPLIGSWRAEAPTPLGYFNLGRWYFAPDRVTAYGYDQPVDYSISGNVVSVIPRDFGPELEFRIVDQNTAQLTTPLVGDLLTLRRVELPPASSGDSDQPTSRARRSPSA
jgi:hypothetical protein